MREGEIACYKQFLLFSQCFPRLYTLVRIYSALCGNGLINLYSLQFLYLSCLAVLRIPVFLMKVAESLPKKVENSILKSRNCSLRVISPFPTDLYCRHVKTRACLGKG